jgi:hypothetical protein
MGRAWAPTMLAMTAAPIAPPMLRMFVFMPFATPV